MVNLPRSEDTIRSTEGSELGSQDPSHAKEPKKENIELPFNPFPVIIDYSLRWGLLSLLKLEWIPEWLFWVAQIAAVPLPILFVTIDHIDTVKKRLNIPVKTEVTSSPSKKVTIFLWLIVLSGCSVTFMLVNGRAEPGWINSLVTSVMVLVTLISYGAYVWLLYEFSVTGDINITEQPVVAKGIESPVDAEVELIDRNDNQIIEMQAELGSVAQRVDTYTLESALFGALAFSGFLSLIASEKPVLTSIHSLLFVCRDLTNLLFSLALQDARDVFVSKIDQNAIIAAVTLETLLCSVLFVSVIISRIRLSDVLKRADYAVRIAAAYNEKEEELHNLALQNIVGPAIERRLASTAARISEAVKSARPLFKELWAISGYMRLFRNFGVASFVLILITSAFLASPTLGLVFTFVFLLAYTYTAVDEFLRRKRLEAIHFFQRHGKLLLRK
jgi:hypothetical protein